MKEIMGKNQNEDIIKLPPELKFAKEIMLHESRLVDDLEIGNLFLSFKTLEKFKYIKIKRFYIRTYNRTNILLQSAI